MTSNNPIIDWSDGVRALNAADPILAQIIERVGHCTLVPELVPFRSLVKSIVHQQLSMTAAGTILRRFLALYPDQPFPEPADLLATSDESLRQVGLSGQKTRYLKDLAQRFLDGTVDPSHFSTMSDEEIIHDLVKVKGIGRWTAEMFLIFCLGRPDVLPVDDLGLQKAVRLHYGADDPRNALPSLSEKWHPYCTLATWYLWRSLDSPTVI